ncbi:MAG: general secretion pathway protein GspK [Myxococcota bacterium]|nr:general secretion pathway protein GspK [Myxococcota bacterium]
MSKRGIVLPMVLIVGLLLSASIFSFLRRSMIDSMLARNREHAAAAEDLARGGISIATAVVFQDRFAKVMGLMRNQHPGASLNDLWARVGESPLLTSWGGSLRITIEDAGSKLNLNALVPVGKTEEESQPSEEAENFLVEFLEKVIGESKGEIDVAGYNPRELARNLLDYMDSDDVGISGKRENDYYAEQVPSYRPSNGPLLSVEEIALVEGFDARIASRIAPYVTVYPLLGEAGINANTAPPHVLAILQHGSGGDMRLADVDIVRSILKIRQEGRIVCNETQSDSERCVSLSEVGLGTGSIFPPVELPQKATVFRVMAEATVEEVVRRIEAVIDISDREHPQLLSWRLL